MAVSSGTSWKILLLQKQLPDDRTDEQQYNEDCDLIQKLTSCEKKEKLIDWR